MRIRLIILSLGLALLAAGAGFCFGHRHDRLQYQHFAPSRLTPDQHWGAPSPTTTFEA
jgi:hypothetical protein